MSRAIFQRGRRRVSVETTHGDTEKCSTGEELAVILAKAGPQFEDDEEDVVDDERPLSISQR